MFLTALQLDVQVDIVDSTGQEDIVISKDMQKLDVDGEREVASPDSRNFLNGDLLHFISIFSPSSSFGVYERGKHGMSRESNRCGESCRGLCSVLISDDAYFYT